MSKIIHELDNERAQRQASEWPEEVRFLLSILEQQCPFSGERRSIPRSTYRVRAAIELVSENDDKSSIFQIYTRDSHAWALGFISDEMLPVGRSARLHLTAPGDRIRCISCTIMRCAGIVDGWFEGAVCFDHEQPAFHPGYVA